MGPIIAHWTHYCPLLTSPAVGPNLQMAASQKRQNDICLICVPLLQCKPSLGLVQIEWPQRARLTQASSCTAAQTASVEQRLALPAVLAPACLMLVLLVLHRYWHVQPVHNQFWLKPTK